MTGLTGSLEAVDIFFHSHPFSSRVRRIILWDPSINEALRELARPAVPAFELLTHLGDGALLLVLGVLIYWFGARANRRSRVFVIAVGVAALALSAGMKGVVQLPRPELAFSPQNYPGYTFPSAHAMGSAAFYGALAVTMEWGTRRSRYLLAGGVISTVAISRVIIGVHYLGDVVVGVLLGLALVAIGVRTRDRGIFDPGPLFALAVIIAGGAAVLGSQVFVTLTLGASIGGLVGWYYVEGRPTTGSGAAVLVAGIGVLAVLGLLRLGSAWVGLAQPEGSLFVLFLVVEVVGYAVLTALVLLLPTLAIRIEDRPTVRWLQSHLPFRYRTLDIESGQAED